MTSDETPTYDVLVAGAGPAGLAATAALAERGLRVGCVAPRHPPRWPNTYGVWRDELDRAGLVGTAARTWSQATVALPPDRHLELDRPYALVDNNKLRERLRKRADQNGADWLEGTVEAVLRDPGDGAVEVHTRSGHIRTARLVVDATGHRDADGTEAGYQVAVGAVLPTDDDAGHSPPRGEDDPWGPDRRETADAHAADDTMTLMDFRPPDGSRRAAPSDPPTFLYAMEVGETRRLYEETILVSRPKMGFRRIEDRLRARLRRHGLTDREALETERVVIPMGRALPDFDPERGRLPFGAAAEMVHPATGYMVGRTLLAVEPMADAVADTLRRRSGGAATPRAARAGWESIWPRDLVRTRHLLRFGMEALLAMDARQTHAFFDAFFSLPQADWRDYLSGTAGPGRTAGIMTKVFSRASLSTKAHLTKVACSPHIRHLFRSLAA